MLTAEEYFKQEREKAEIKAKEREEKWTKEIMEEIKEWDSDKLEDEYIKLRLSRISYYDPITPGMAWDLFHEECRFCGLEYIQGEHNDCCDDCWEENKDKTLSDLENG